MNRNWLLHLYYMHLLWRHSCWKYVGKYSTQFYKSMMDSGLSPGFMQTYPSPPENKSGCGLWIHGVLKFQCFEMLFRKRSIRNSKWVGQLSHYLQPFFLHPFAFGIAVLPALSPTIAWTYSCRQFWKCRLRASETSLIRNRLGLQHLQLPPNFWWSLINPGAIPACALKIIKFMLGFTATRWYKYVHVSICKCLDRFWKLTSCFVWRSSLRSVIRCREVFEKPEGSSESGRTCQTHLNAHLI